MSGSFFGSRRRTHGPGVNAPPDPQSATQASVVVDKDSMALSYRQHTEDTKASGEKFVCTYFTPKIAVTRPTDVYTINPYDILWAPKSRLVGAYHTSGKGFHRSDVVDMLLTRCAFNNFQFEDVTDYFIQWLSTETEHGHNDKYISELMTALVMPIGVSKSTVEFSVDPAKNCPTQTLELMTSGCVLTKIRKRDGFLRHGYHVRWTVPTPTEWNNSQWYVLDEPVGKISMQAESITVKSDEIKIRTIHTGFFSNDCHRMNGWLKDVHERHKSVQPLMAIPNDFLHLLAAIYIKTTEMDIASGVLEVNNRYKYLSLVPVIRDYLRANSARTIEENFTNLLQRTKDQSIDQMASLIATVYLDEFKSTTSETPETLRNAIVNVLATLTGNRPANHLIDIFDLGGIDFEAFSKDGFSESDWEAMFGQIGDEAFDWSKILYYKNAGTGIKPVTENIDTAATPLDVSMIGDYVFRSQTAPTGGPAAPQITKEIAMEQRKTAAEDWAIMASQVLGLTVSSGFHANASTKSVAEGYLYTHRNDPDFQRIVRESEGRGRRMIIEVARQLTASYLPSAMKEQSSIGFDRKTRQNKGMKSNKSGFHMPDDFSDLGRMIKENGAIFDNFIHGIAAFTNKEREQVKLTVVEAGKTGNIAVAYVK